MPDTLIATRGAGSTLVEAGYALAGVELRIEYMDYEQPGPEQDRLIRLNPLRQVPTLLRADGSLMTESAAILLHLAEMQPQARLMPEPRDPRRADFLRWLLFLNAAIYPTFTYGDEPRQWVEGEAAAAQLRASTHRRREHGWRQLERSLEPAPWLLGADFSLLDLYVGVMSRWRPRRDWFARECPRLHAVALAVDAKPELAEVWKRNFA
jgi:GST-like protein